MKLAAPALLTGVLLLIVLLLTAGSCEPPKAPAYDRHHGWSTENGSSMVRRDHDGPVMTPFPFRRPAVMEELLPGELPALQKAPR